MKIEKKRKQKPYDYKATRILNRIKYFNNTKERNKGTITNVTSRKSVAK